MARRGQVPGSQACLQVAATMTPQAQLPVTLFCQGVLPLCASACTTLPLQPEPVSR